MRKMSNLLVLPWAAREGDIVGVHIDRCINISTLTSSIVTQALTQKMRWPSGLPIVNFTAIRRVAG